MTDLEGPSFSRSFDTGTDAVWEAVESAAEQWGGQFEREGEAAELVLPVAAGLRHGLAEVRAHVAGGRARADLTLSQTAAHYQLHLTGVAMLAVAGLGALITILCPFFPGLLPFLPIGILLAVAGWLVVVSRVRMSGLDDFLGTVESLLGEAPTSPGA